MAMGTIRALYRRIFKALLIDFFFQMASLSRPNAVDTSPMRHIISLALFGTTLPRNTNSSTCSTYSPSMTIRWSFGDINLHLAPFIFIPNFWHAFSSCEVGRWNFSKKV